MAWMNYPTLPNGYPAAGQPAQGQGVASLLPYSPAQLNDPRVPLDIRNAMQGAQQMQAAAMSTAPHTSMMASGLQGLAGYLGGQQEQQATQAAAPYQGQPAQGGQADASLLARLLRGGSGSGSTPTPDDMSSQAPLQGWAGVGQGVGQMAQSIGHKSDRRLKSDVVRVGTLKRTGLPLYVYRLEGSPLFEVGCMADEVALVCPDATWFDPDDGFARVAYERLI